MEYRQRTEASNTDFAVCFETGTVKDKHLLSYYLIAELLGKVEVNHFDPLNVGSGLLTTELYQK